ncbi:MAG: PDZ domain-containing protein [Deltaproteobacteria bacterium]|nr:PDZ domain-containing protein [Deltaproteobacteria bacterium]
MNAMNEELSFKKVFVLLGIWTFCATGCLNHQNIWSNGGLGVHLAQVEDGVIIKEVAPTFNNPDAALLKGDFIVRVNDTDVSNWTKEAILDAIEGPAGSYVTVTVNRKGTLITLEIERILQKDVQRRTLYSVLKPTAEPTQPSVATSVAAPASSTAAKTTDAEDSGKRETPSSDSDGRSLKKDIATTDAKQNAQDPSDSGKPGAAPNSKNVSDDVSTDAETAPVDENTSQNPSDTDAS